MKDAGQATRGTARGGLLSKMEFEEVEAAGQKYPGLHCPLQAAEANPVESP
jgi:hypothetical protein